MPSDYGEKKKKKKKNLMTNKATYCNYNLIKEVASQYMATTVMFFLKGRPYASFILVVLFRARKPSVQQKGMALAS